jgi:hypothetical protein
MNIPVTQLLVQLVEQHTDISAIRLFRPRLSPPIQEAPGLSAAESQLVGEALDLRSATGFPFWDCLLQRIAIKAVQADTLLHMAQRHNSQSPSIEAIQRNDVTISTFESVMGRLEPGQMLAASSRVERAGKEDMHIPMLDFHCSVSAENDQRVRFIAIALGLHGYIVHSGQSYHFYGSGLIATEELVTLLSSALLFSPIIDRAWIAHQIIERACGLRISSGKTYPHPPLVVDEV